VRRILALGSLLVVTAALAGCISYGDPHGGPYAGHDGSGWAAFGAAMGAMAAMLVMLVLVFLVAVVVIVVVAGVALAKSASGGSPLAGAALLTLGLLLAVFALPAGSLVLLLLGAALAVLGGVALAEGRPREA
jgi:hypothetical protein